jgi:ABC-type transport system involved in Fe-S cluster assembly fused permease/ATPase subunit
MCYEIFLASFSFVFSFLACVVAVSDVCICGMFSWCYKLWFLVCVCVCVCVYMCVKSKFHLLCALSTTQILFWTKTENSKTEAKILLSTIWQSSPYLVIILSIYLPMAL